jgi:UDP-2,3-diacylglucosamine hydrolase
MSLFVLSDLHIWGADDPIYRSLLEVIKNKAVKGDTLVLAGDVFELFVGDKPIFTERYREFIDELSAAEKRGVKIHYIEGNHDFLMKKVFEAHPGIRIHPKEFSEEMGGKRFYFAHGDLVDRTDYSYLALRIFLRSPLMKALVGITPGSLLDRIGNRSSQLSQKKNQRLPARLSTEKIQGLRKMYRSFAAEQLNQGYDFVVMGHCHDLDEMCFMIGGRQGQYMNVGFPRVHGSFLSWTPGEEKITREPLPTV